MRTDDFDYYLDESLIAQTPLDKRDESKFMLVDKNTGFYKHESFKNIGNYLSAGDVLVLNRWQRICQQCGRSGFEPWVGKIPWQRAWQPTPVSLPGKSPWTEEPGRLESMESQRL